MSMPPLKVEKGISDESKAIAKLQPIIFVERKVMKRKLPATLEGSSCCPASIPDSEVCGGAAKFILSTLKNLAEERNRAGFDIGPWLELPVPSSK